MVCHTCADKWIGSERAVTWLDMGPDCCDDCTLAGLAMWGLNRCDDRSELCWQRSLHAPPFCFQLTTYCLAHTAKFP